MVRRSTKSRHRTNIRQKFILLRILKNLARGKTHLINIIDGKKVNIYRLVREAKIKVVIFLKFEYIDRFLRDKGLGNPKLEILTPDARFYKALLFQPCGTIEVGDYFVRNNDQDLTIKKFKSFFDLAKQENIDIAISPEYSCPWEVIREIINHDVLPENKKLWVIGCESIKPNELKGIIEENSQITWIYEDEKVNTITEEVFLDPICYFLKTEQMNNSGLRNVIFIQFKTNPMGGKPFEIQRLLPGEYIYIFRNEGYSINLVTTICSDSLSLNIDNIPDYIEKSYLLIHLQLNLNPQNANFSKYRKDCYINNYPRKEFICLNWARKTDLAGNIMDFGGSALYTKSEELDLSDKQIDHNHKNGLYYTNWKYVRGNIYFFNYNEHIFILENSKTSQLGVSPQNRIALGPKMKAIYSWTEQNCWCRIQNASDGFNELCNNIGGDFSSLLSLQPIDIERLIALSTGLATFSEWYTPKKIDFFNVNENETNQRITFLHDPNPEINERKEKYINLFGRLNTSIITDENNFPTNIKDLANNCSLQYRPDKGDISTYNFNLYPKNEGTPATAVFIGHKTLMKARTILTSMNEFLSSSQSKEKGYNQWGKRVVVWFIDVSGNIVPIYNETKPTISENVTIPDNSFLKRS